MTIDRIGSYANTQLMLAHVMKAENALDVSNRQIATGKLADNLCGYRDKTAVMEAAAGVGAGRRQCRDRNQAAARLDVQDTQLSQPAR